MFHIEEILKWSGGTLDGHVEKSIASWSINTKEISPNACFVAFKGQRVNGEDYVEDAFKKGASLAMVSHTYMGPWRPVLRVDDVQVALQEIAKGYRKKCGIPIVGITGSVGKTSTKDIVAHMLSSTYKILKTKGNYNNEIGLPLMLLAIEPEHDLAILEMGMNHFGELARLADLADHQYALMTNIGTAHIEFLGSQEGIFKAKCEILSSLREGGLVVVNAKDPYLKTITSNTFDVVQVGAETSAIHASDVEVGDFGTRFTLHIDKETHVIEMPLYGEHHIDNVLLGIALGLRLRVPLEKMLAQLPSVRLTGMRFEKHVVNEVTWINDAYNASSDSILAAIHTFKALSAQRKWLVLGDIFECGDESHKIHSALGRAMTSDGLHEVCFVGEAMQAAKASYMGTSEWFGSIKEVVDYLKTHVKKGDAVLLKASRGMHFEDILTGVQS